MGIENCNPQFHFNFLNHEGNISPLVFTEPKRTIVAWEIDEVIDSLEMVQKAVNDGNYAAGYISYEAAPAFDRDLQVGKGNKAPLLLFSIFNEPSTNPIDSNNSFHIKSWKSNVTIDSYYKNIEKIKKYIRQGKTDQVNYTIQMDSEFTGDSISFFKQLEKVQSANYAAYMDIGDYTILSASPELFFQTKNGRITTRPMKGTIDRGKTYEEDLKNEAWLRTSEKNRTENRLTVELMQRDLEKIAKPGTIDVQGLYSIEKYPTVFQMTSTVSAEIAPGKNMIDIFKALFPCGSITGSPKKKTMEIIAELETNPREVYCGAIGYITPKNEAVFNVPIRTVLIDNRNGRAQYGVGGGITLNSTKEEEYREVLMKAKLLKEKRPEFQLLETLGLFNGNYVVLKNHLERLGKSAEYFNFIIDLKEIKNALISFSQRVNKRQWKVRLLVNKNGAFSIEKEELTPITDDMQVILSEKPVSNEDIFLYHKTTNRNVYKVHQKQEDAFDVLLWNEDSEVTEFTMGNIVVELDGKLVTPPIECGLLAGTFRSALLHDGTITERKLLLDELVDCTSIWFINSVRKWVPVHLLK